MVHISPETIPAKVYFKIIDGGPLTLLTDEKNVSNEVLEAAWKSIETNYKRDDNKEQTKTLDLQKRMERFSARLESVVLSVHYLRTIKDDELISNLKGWNFRFDWKKENEYESEAIAEAIYQNDLNRIERESETIKHKIDRLMVQLPKRDENDDAEDVAMSFDESVLMYAAFTGLGYVNPNDIPLTQYDALIKAGNKKMKALENQNQAAKNGKRK